MISDDGPRPRRRRLHRMTTRLGDFSPQAEAYARARPGYPADMVDLLLDLAGVAPGDAVAELGAGTGIFTELLARYELRVTAVEPNAAMSSKARKLDGVEWHGGTFEDTGLVTRSQKWIVAAQAFHWADPERALPELHRALVPGGSLTVLWNHRDVPRSPVLTFTRQLIEEIVPGFDEGYRDRDWWRVLTSTGHFVAPFALDVPHVVTMDAERYLDLWRSHNHLNAAADPGPMEQLLRRIEERLDKTGPIDVPYVCRVWTAKASTEI